MQKFNFFSKSIYKNSLSFKFRICALNYISMKNKIKFYLNKNEEESRNKNLKQNKKNFCILFMAW